MYAYTAYIHVCVYCIYILHIYTYTAYHTGRGISADIFHTIPARFLWVPNNLREEQEGVRPKQCDAGAVQDAMRMNRICFLWQGVGVRLRTCVRLRRCPPSRAAGFYAQPRYMRKRCVFPWFSLKNTVRFMVSKLLAVRLLVQVLSNSEVTYIQRGGPRPLVPARS